MRRSRPLQMNRRQAGSPSEATLRVGGALGIADVLRDFGIDPAEVLREAGIAPRLFDDPDNLITYRSRGRLMACAVNRTGCQHFGLLVGQRMNLQSLGLVGLLARNAPDVGTALRSIVNYLHLHARGAVMDLKVDHTLAMLTYDAYQPNVQATDQTGSGAVAMMVNVMRTLCQTDFQPIEARFACRAPDDVRPFRKFFQVPLRFDADHYALLFSSDWLDRQVHGTDPELGRLLQKQIDALEARHGAEFPEIVRSVLRSALLTGQGSLEQIAALLGMHSRTLNRRLEEFGTGFQQLVDASRFEIARQMLEVTSLTVGEIAEAIGYASASAFVRAFRRWSGTTPVGWRTKSTPVRDTTVT
jgi:AraC-like DNA-binding protein